MLQSRTLLLFLPLVLIPALLAPYALFTSDFRVLIWAIREPYLPFWSLLAINIFGAVISGVMLYRLRPIGIRIFELCALVTLVHVSYLAMLEKRHGILVLAFIIAALFVAAREWIFRILSLPFFHSSRNWWESIPKSLPNLSANLNGREGEQKHLIVSNIGEDGCFVFGDRHAPLDHPKRVSIVSGDRVLFTCPVALEYRTKDRLGLGLRFLSSEIEPDLTKDMAEFIGLLRRRGYVD